MTLIWMKAQSYPDGNVWEILYYRRSIGFPGEKKRVIEPITAGLILSGLTFLLGKLTSILIGMIQVA